MDVEATLRSGEAVSVRGLAAARGCGLEEARRELWALFVAEQSSVSFGSLHAIVLHTKTDPACISLGLERIARGGPFPPEAQARLYALSCSPDAPLASIVSANAAAVFGAQALAHGLAPDTAAIEPAAKRHDSGVSQSENAVTSEAPCVAPTVQQAQSSAKPTKSSAKQGNLLSFFGAKKA